jgi:hypothetical protein
MLSDTNEPIKQQESHKSNCICNKVELHMDEQQLPPLDKNKRISTRKNERLNRKLQYGIDCVDELHFARWFDIINYQGARRGICQIPGHQKRRNENTKD